MGWFKKKPDLISDRARTLNNEIAELEARIKQLDTQIQHDDSQPRLRPAAVPHGSSVNHSMAATQAAPARHEPVFEDLGQDFAKARAEHTSTPEHYNELGVRKYDLPALWRRLQQNFRGPSTTNPKLVSYLAAGGLQGLSPLRYEKRVARNRFIAFVVFLFVILVGVVWVFVKHR